MLNRPRSSDTVGHRAAAWRQAISCSAAPPPYAEYTCRILGSAVPTQDAGIYAGSSQAVLAAMASQQGGAHEPHKV
jgi:hypothetical protein